MPAIGARKAIGLIPLAPQSSASSAGWTIGGVQLSLFQCYVEGWVDICGDARPSVSEFDLWQAAEKMGKDPNGPRVMQL